MGGKLPAFVFAVAVGALGSNEWELAWAWDGHPFSFGIPVFCLKFKISKLGPRRVLYKMLYMLIIQVRGSAYQSTVNSTGFYGCTQMGRP